jgi:hypothetical protein
MCLIALHWRWLTCVPLYRLYNKSLLVHMFSISLNIYKQCVMILLLLSWLVKCNTPLTQPQCNWWNNLLPSAVGNKLIGQLVKVIYFVYLFFHKGSSVLILTETHKDGSEVSVAAICCSVSLITSSYLLVPVVYWIYIISQLSLSYSFSVQELHGYLFWPYCHHLILICLYVNLTDCFLL